jgi:hypothetical protein
MALIHYVEDEVFQKALRELIILQTSRLLDSDYALLRSSGVEVDPVSGSDMLSFVDEVGRNAR